MSMSLPFLMFCPRHFNGTLIRPQPPALANSKALTEPPVFFSTWSTSSDLASWVFPLLPSAQSPTGIHTMRPVPSALGFLVRQDNPGQGVKEEAKSRAGWWQDGAGRGLEMGWRSHSKSLPLASGLVTLPCKTIFILFP